MAVPTQDIKNQVYFHGCPDDASGYSILQAGIQPGNINIKRRGHLVPVIGKTYLTGDLRYAIIYCVGGDMTGYSEKSIEEFLARGDKSQYGWLFSINGDTFTSDVQPDEDSVGEAIMIVSRIIKGDAKFYGDNAFYQGLSKMSRGWQEWFLDCAKRALTPKQWAGTLDGEVAAWASGGKRFLKVMSDDIKLKLISCGAHVAYSGPLVPDQAWRFDKRLTPKLMKDCSNFFELAERVR